MRSSKPKSDDQNLIALLSAAILAVFVVIFFLVGQDKEESQEAVVTEAVPQPEKVEIRPAGGAMPAMDEFSIEVGEVELLEEQEMEAEEAEAIEVQDATAAEEATEVSEPVWDDAPTPKRKKKSQSAKKAKPAVDAPLPEEPKARLVTVLAITSAPKGASIALDGIFVGRAPMAKIVIAPGRHMLAASLAGYEPKIERFHSSEGEKKSVSLKMKKITELVVPKAVATKAQPQVRVERAARTPRVPAANSGNLGRGKASLGSTCNSCHASEGVKRVSSKRYTRSQWDRFFAAGSHDRYQRLGGKVSQGQLANVKAYLKSKAADAARNQGAGIR